jgi:pseudaminic acid cytidylyltransferase
MNLALIPARAGSRRIKGKNVRLFHGKPIIAYSIDTARQSGLFQEIVVSTDSEDYAAVAKAYGAKVHMRSKKMSADEVGTQDVAKLVLEWWATCHPDRPAELACCIYACAPTMLPEDLLRGYTSLLKHELDYAYVEGWFYMGYADRFLADLGLDMGQSRKILVPEERWVDINTEEDWQHAERLYGALQREHMV